MKFGLNIIGPLIVSMAIPAYAQSDSEAAPAPRGDEATPTQQQPKPVRSEIRHFDNWSLRCVEYEKPKETRCSASLTVAQQKSKQIVFAWNVALADEKKLVGTLVTPTGVLIEHGIELKLGKARTHKIPFMSCTPNQCAGTMAMDEAIVREATRAEKAEATIRSIDGRTIRFAFPVKGFERAVAQLRKAEAR